MIRSFFHTCTPKHTYTVISPLINKGMNKTRQEEEEMETTLTIARNTHACMHEPAEDI